jgi:hypothetical protein
MKVMHFYQTSPGPDGGAHETGDEINRLSTKFRRSIDSRKASHSGGLGAETPCEQGLGSMSANGANYHVLGLRCA